MELGTLLRPNEEEINRKEYRPRHIPFTYLGLQQGMWLIEHQDDQELAPVKALCGKVSIDLLGIEVLSSKGFSFFPCLDGNSGPWELIWSYAEVGLSRNIRVARPCQ